MAPKANASPSRGEVPDPNSSIITNEELIFGVTAIAVGMKNDYIDISR